MRSFQSIIWVLCAGMMFSCGNEKANEDLNAFPIEKLVGKWENISKKNQHLEEWELVGDGHLLGKGFIISSGDTVFIEHLEMVKSRNGEFIYFAQVADQNESKPIPFKMKSDDGEELIFENEKHDFPQRIGYRLVSNVEMMVYIEGEREGTVDRKEFYFLRKQ